MQFQSQSQTTTVNSNAGNFKRNPRFNQAKSVVQGRKKINKVIPIQDFKLENLIFDTLVANEKEDKGRKIPYYTCNLHLENPTDKSVGTVQLRLPRLYCYGVNVFKDETVNHTMTLALGPRDGADESTNMMVDTFNKFGEAYMKMLDSNREVLNLYKDDDLQRKKLLYSPMFKWKTDRGQNVGSPTLKVKLWESQYSNGVRLPEPIVYTTFYDGTCVEPNGNYKVMKLSDLLPKDGEQKQIPFYVSATIRVMSAFIGSVLNYKVVVTEAVVFKANFKPNRFMAKPDKDDLEFAAKLREESGESVQQAITNPGNWAELSDHEQD